MYNTFFVYTWIVATPYHASKCKTIAENMVYSLDCPRLQFQRSNGHVHVQYIFCTPYQAKCKTIAKNMAMMFTP